MSTLEIVLAILFAPVWITFGLSMLWMLGFASFAPWWVLYRWVFCGEDPRRPSNPSRKKRPNG